MAKSGKNWSEEELKAAVDAYLEMLQLESSGRPYSKAEINKRLRDNVLSNRSKGSIEYRMQNISATLHELCLPWIQGYKPASNVGSRIKDQIKEMLSRKGAVDKQIYLPTAEYEELDNKVQALRSGLKVALLNGEPRGITTPEKVTSSTTSHKRDPLVKAWVLETANGFCEACGSSAPFATSGGIPFLEVHHMNLLADGGPDTIANTVAICPNCHRRLHHARDKEEFKNHHDRAGLNEA
ncbi:MAG: HNH endonuclease [Magnetococcales bacterium]|nr:HNH endonuclease [Magnetococcales bacterium]